MGIANDLRSRLEWHNCAKSGYTVDHRPWSVVVSIEFQAEREAVRNLNDAGRRWSVPIQESSGSRSERP